MLSFEPSNSNQGTTTGTQAPAAGLAIPSNLFGAPNSAVGTPKKRCRGT